MTKVFLFLYLVVGLVVFQSCATEQSESQLLDNSLSCNQFPHIIVPPVNIIDPMSCHAAAQFRELKLMAEIELLRNGCNGINPTILEDQSRKFQDDMDKCVTNYLDTH